MEEKPHLLDPTASNFKERRLAVLKRRHRVWRRLQTAEALGEDVGGVEIEVTDVLNE